MQHWLCIMFGAIRYGQARVLQAALPPTPEDQGWLVVLQCSPHESLIDPDLLRF